MAYKLINKKINLFIGDIKKYNICIKSFITKGYTNRFDDRLLMTLNYLSMVKLLENISILLLSKDPIAIPSLTRDTMDLFANFMCIYNVYYEIESLPSNKKYMIENRYHGQHRSEAAFVEELAGEIYEIPDYLEYYIDYEAMARDWFINDYLSLEVNGDVHVFSYS